MYKKPNKEFPKPQSGKKKEAFSLSQDEIDNIKRLLLELKEKKRDKKSDLLAITAVTPETTLTAESFPQPESAAEPPPNPATPESELDPPLTQTESQTPVESAEEEVKNPPPPSAVLVVQLDQK